MGACLSLNLHFSGESRVCFLEVQIVPKCSHRNGTLNIGQSAFRFPMGIQVVGMVAEILLVSGADLHLLFSASVRSTFELGCKNRWNETEVRCCNICPLWKYLRGISEVLCEAEENVRSDHLILSLRPFRS